VVESVAEDFDIYRGDDTATNSVLMRVLQRFNFVNCWTVAIDILLCKEMLDCALYGFHRSGPELKSHIGLSVLTVNFCVSLSMVGLTIISYEHITQLATSTFCLLTRFLKFIFRIQLHHGVRKTRIF